MWCGQGGHFAEVQGLTFAHLNFQKHCTLDSIQLMGLQLLDCIARVLLFCGFWLAARTLFFYRPICSIQPSSPQWLRLTGALAVPVIRSAKLTRCPGPLNPFLS